MQINYQINEETLRDCINISVGLFTPLNGFMNSHDYKSVIENMQLSNGEEWTCHLYTSQSKRDLYTSLKQSSA